ncbi:nuclease [Cinnamomum micranthum f. kanehirae]|uniref:Nuclease n=1 Tax=Cinnamomum micranthum f. kanehirae TaxID=337451 RepID=A0A3S3QRE9_9MAGN|nr:nuclease [Cinnamomum micranthum f. kanehirae]
MSHSLFLCIQSVLEANEPYFVQRKNNVERLGLSSFQKMIAAIRMLAYGGTTDLCDEYLRIGESTALKSLKKFVKAMITNFSEEYLWSPNNNDIAKLLAEGESQGTRKDVECAFGVLQARFAIVRGPARLFQLTDLKYIMMACIILRNMMIEDERISMMLKELFMSNSMKLLVNQCHAILHFWRTSLKIIVALEIEKLIPNSNLTLSSICGNYIVSCRP